MSFLDRVSKAVTGAVDRSGRKQTSLCGSKRSTARSGISRKRYGEFKNQIQAIKVQIGEKAVEMLRAGNLSSPELQALMDQIAGSRS